MGVFVVGVDVGVERRSYICSLYISSIDIFKVVEGEEKMLVIIRGSNPCSEPLPPRRVQVLPEPETPKENKTEFLELKDDSIMGEPIVS